MVILSIAAASPLFGQSFGRVVGTVRGESGEALEGVVVAVINTETAAIVAETTTDPEGRYDLRLKDARKRYLYRFQKQGYEVFEHQIRSEPLSNTVNNVVLRKALPPAGEPALTTADIFDQGVTAFNEGRYQDAEQDFLQTLGSDPGLGQAHGALAQVYLKQARYEEAIDSARRYLSVAPDDQATLMVLYEAYKETGRQQQAQEVYAHLSTLIQPAIVAYNEGKSAFKAGDLDSARTKFEEAVSLDPKLAAAHEALAWIFLNRGEFTEAAGSANRVLELEPGNTNALSVRFEAYRSLGDEEGADEILGRLFEVAPNQTGQHLYEEGMGLFETNRVDKALAVFQLILRYSPDHARSHYMAGLCLANTGDSLKAMEHLRLFLELTPDDPDADTARQMIEYLEAGIHN